MNKRALVIGINYTGTPSALNGCINDAMSVREELVKRGYPENNITLLTDDTDVKPTRENILKALLALIVSDATELYFHYSGHGISVRDLDGDEDDGKDECLVPLDYRYGNMILDDEIRGLLYCLSERQRMFCVLDCCHSGTGMDLKYNLYERYGGRYLSMMDDRKQRPTRGQCIMLSGCQDPQTSADAWEEGKFQGAMTYSFLRALEECGSRARYEDLIKRIRAILKEKGYSQLPSLSAGKPLNLRSRVQL
jgi:hypothetical protein